MAVVQVAVTTPADLAGVAGRAWARAATVVVEGLSPVGAWLRGEATAARNGLRELAWPWAAWAVLLSPTRWWTEAFVTLSAGSAVPGQLAGLAESLGASARAALRSLPRRPTRVARPRPDRPRPRWLTPRHAFRAAVWAVVVVEVGLFAASLGVPLWYQLHGQRLLIVTSGSMSPFVEAGDVAVLQKISDPSQLRVGQVATFWPPGSKHLITHRIVDLKMLPALVAGETGQMVEQRNAAGQVIERPYIYTKGDANATRDPNATPLALVSGVVVAAHSGWGTWLGWAQSPVGRFILLAPPLALLGALELVDLIAERRLRAVRRPARSLAPREVTDALGAI